MCLEGTAQVRSRGRAGVHPDALIRGGRQAKPIQTCAPSLRFFEWPWDPLERIGANPGYLLLSRSLQALGEASVRTAAVDGPLGCVASFACLP